MRIHQVLSLVSFVLIADSAVSIPDVSNMFLEKLIHHNPISKVFQAGNTLCTSFLRQAFDNFYFLPLQIVYE